MEPISLEYIAKITHGRLINPSQQRITGVSTDTRTIKPGDLYVPLIGERFNGHKFIATAFGNGASATLSAGETPVIDKPVIRVDDTLTALQDLAAAYRQLFQIPVIAITGSHGKTTTKDLIAHVLSEKFNVHATYRNLNGLIGVPLTILALEHTHEILVIETGISKPGEMDILGNIVRPNLAIFTCAALAHTEFLVDIPMIAAEKSRLFHYLADDGIKLINADDPAIAPDDSSTRTIKYGFSSADFRGEILEISPGKSRFRVHRNDTPALEFILPLSGEFNITNAIAAVTVGLEFGLNPEEIQRGLNTIKLSPHRCAMEKIRGVTVIDDSYNAAPTSMLSSLKMLANLKNGSRRIAVLGDMLELGDQSESAHRSVGKMVAELGIDMVFTFGKDAEFIKSEAENGGSISFHFDSKEDLAEKLIQTASAGDVILFKASRSMAAEKILALFRNN